MSHKKICDTRRDGLVGCLSCSAETRNGLSASHHRKPARRHHVRGCPCCAVWLPKNESPLGAIAASSSPGARPRLKLSFESSARFCLERMPTKCNTLAYAARDTSGKLSFFAFDRHVTSSLSVSELLAPMAPSAEPGCVRLSRRQCLTSARPSLQARARRHRRRIQDRILWDLPQASCCDDSRAARCEDAFFSRSPKRSVRLCTVFLAVISTRCARSGARRHILSCRVRIPCGLPDRSLKLDSGPTVVPQRARVPCSAGRSQATDSRTLDDSSTPLRPQDTSW